MKPISDDDRQREDTAIEEALWDQHQWERTMELYEYGEDGFCNGFAKE